MLIELWPEEAYPVVGFGLFRRGGTGGVAGKGGRAYLLGFAHGGVGFQHAGDLHRKEAGKDEVY